MSIPSDKEVAIRAEVTAFIEEGVRSTMPEASEQDIQLELESVTEAEIIAAAQTYTENIREAGISQVDFVKGMCRARGLEDDIDGLDNKVAANLMEAHPEAGLSQQTLERMADHDLGYEDF